MREWDIECFNRKFQETLCVFPFGVAICDGMVENKQIHCQTETDKFLTEDEPLYFHVESRYYNSNKGFVLLQRKKKKSFKVGVCHDNFHITFFNGANFIGTKLTDSLKFDVFTSLTKEGPISEKLYINKREVFYLNKLVGYRKGSKFLVDPSVWQEVSDSLWGLECSIQK